VARTSAIQVLINNIASNLTLSHVTVINATTPLLFSCATGSFPGCFVAETASMQVTMQNVTIPKGLKAKQWFSLSNTILSVSSCTFIGDSTSTTGISPTLSHSHSATRAFIRLMTYLHCGITADQCSISMDVLRPSLTSRSVELVNLQFVLSMYSAPPSRRATSNLLAHKLSSTGFCMYRFDIPNRSVAGNEWLAIERCTFHALPSGIEVTNQRLSVHRSVFFQSQRAIELISKVLRA